MYAYCCLIEICCVRFWRWGREGYVYADSFSYKKGRADFMTLPLGLYVIIDNQSAERTGHT